jgi:hypothetical protein
LIISRRLERLDENEKRVFAAAAVIGHSFSFRLLTAISQVGMVAVEVWTRRQDFRATIPLCPAADPRTQKVTGSAFPPLG